MEALARSPVMQSWLVALVAFAVLFATALWGVPFADAGAAQAVETGLMTAGAVAFFANPAIFGLTSRLLQTFLPRVWVNDEFLTASGEPRWAGLLVHAGLAFLVIAILVGSGSSIHRSGLSPVRLFAGETKPEEEAR